MKKSRKKPSKELVELRCHGPGTSAAFTVMLRKAEVEYVRDDSSDARTLVRTRSGAVLEVVGNYAQTVAAVFG